MKEGINVSAIPLEQRQVILNFTNLVNVDSLLIRTILFDLHLHQEKKISKNQIYLNGLTPIDELLADREQHMIGFKDNTPFASQFRKDKLRIETLIDAIYNGLLHIFNDYKDDAHIDFKIISIEWLLKAMMGAIFSILLRYASDEKMTALGIHRDTFDHSPFSSNTSFEKFYGVKDFENLVLFNDQQYYSFLVDCVISACRELKEMPVQRTLVELYSTELVYKYLIPQNIFSSLFNDKVPLMNKLYSYRIGYS